MSKRTRTAYRAHLLIVAKLRATRQMSSGSAQIWPIVAVNVSSFHISAKYVKMSIEMTVAALDINTDFGSQDELTVSSIVWDGE
jgi:hypothetical protein